MGRTMLATLTRAMIDELISMDSLAESSQKPAYLLRPLPFLEGADEVILEVCMSSPMYLRGISIRSRVTTTVDRSVELTIARTCCRPQASRVRS